MDNYYKKQQVFSLCPSIVLDVLLVQVPLIHEIRIRLAKQQVVIFQDFFLYFLSFTVVLYVIFYVFYRHHSYCLISSLIFFLLVFFFCVHFSSLFRKISEAAIHFHTPYSQFFFNNSFHGRAFDFYFKSTWQVYLKVCKSNFGQDNEINKFLSTLSTLSRAFLQYTE